MEYRCTACGSKEPCRFINGKKNRILGRPLRCVYGEYDKVKWVILYEKPIKKV